MAFRFSYKPYTPFGHENDYAIHIVRLSPSETSLELSWLGNGKNYTVSVCSDGVAVKKATVGENKAVIDGLVPDTDYTVCVSGEKNASSRIRPFRTGNYRGTVINYLSPSDAQYDFSGRFLATPSIVRFKGDLYVSADTFGYASDKCAYNLTLLFRSKDNGKTWEYVTDLVPAFWGTLFVANNRLCILACSTESGSLLVSASDDGENWDAPVFLMYGAGHGFAGPHKSSGSMCEFGGRLWFGIECGEHSVIRFDSIIASVDKDKVMDASAWVISESRLVEHEWGGDGKGRFAIEGNIVERNGELFDLLRFQPGKALMLKVDTDNPKNAPSFYKVVNLPLGHCKFHIRKAQDGTYYAMGNTACYPRHVVRIYKSKNLEEWELVKTVEDISHLSAEQDGVQYPSFVLEDNRLYTVLRTALNGADTFHNSNATVFNVYSTEKE